MKKQIAFILGLIYSLQCLAQTMVLSPDFWEHREAGAEFLEYKGRKAIRLNQNSGPVFYKNFNFKDGTIELDFEVNQASPFATLYFRQKDNHAEHVYIRTGAAINPLAFDALQYASIIKGVNLWDLQHEFQTAAQIKVNDWNHLKIVVSGRQLKVWLNRSESPNLHIPNLEGVTMEGRIGLESGFPGETVFANIVIKAGVTEGLSPEPGSDLTQHDTRYLRNWYITKPDTLGYGREVNASMIPKQDISWEPIQSGPRSLINVSARFGGNAGRRLVWLKTIIKADEAQSQILKLGFSDEIWVFMNGRPIFVDKDNYLQGMRKSPNGRISLDNCRFPLNLQKGENELMIGLANDFYGWGLIARLEHVNGISF